MIISFFFILCFGCSRVISDHCKAEISNTGPVVLGANITFRAQVFRDGKIYQRMFRFEWLDDMSPTNFMSEIRQGMSEWTVSHSPSKYISGNYTVQVNVFEPDSKIWHLCSKRNDFTLEKYLIGDLILKENVTAEPLDKYVSNSTNLLHQIQLNHSDEQYLRKNTMNWSTSWSIDNRSPIMVKENLSWSHCYSTPDVSHTITAMIIGQLIETNRSTDLAYTVSSEPSPDINIMRNSSFPVDMRLNSSVNLTNKEKLSYSTYINATEIDARNKCSDSKKYVCGIYKRNITVKAPISNVQVQGSGWLPHGDMLDLLLTCNGSAPFQFCVRFFYGEHNTTGNYSCKYYISTSAKCEFRVTHYFNNSTHYTVLLIVRNDVRKYVQAFGVDVYEVTKHPQLSVVVVPVAACLLALILVIFGIAFYFQNKSSYAVEVADFNFANNNEMEYKTFKERLAEALHNALNKTEEFSEEESSNGGPSTCNKYGSMQ